MARKPSGKPNGRPHKEIDHKSFEELCKLHCTHSEICSTLHSAKETLEDWCVRTYGETFSNCYKRFSEMGRPSLRRSQYIAAQKGNPTMLIWMGKQWLGQRDREEEDKKSPYQAAIDERHKIMFLEAEVEKLKDKLRGTDNSQTDSDASSVR